jgi:hypothetical protein
MTVPISLLAKEIRSNVLELESVHDDYTCIQKWADKAGFWINVKKVEIPPSENVSQIMRDFIDNIFNKRTELLKQQTAMATEAFQNFKVLLTKLLKEDETLQACKDIAPNDTPYLVGLIDDMESIRAAINAYYATKVQSEGGPAFFRSLGETLFKALEILEEGKEVPLDFFKGDSSGIDESVHKLSKIFATVKPSVRQQIVNSLRSFMHHALSCFVLYRMPVEMLKGQPPIYFSRYLPHVLLKQYLEKYGVNFSNFVIS